MLKTSKQTWCVVVKSGHARVLGSFPPVPVHACVRACVCYKSTWSCNDGFGPGSLHHPSAWVAGDVCVLVRHRWGMRESWAPAPAAAQPLRVALGRAVLLRGGRRALRCVALRCVRAGAVAPAAPDSMLAFAA